MTGHQECRRKMAKKLSTTEQNLTNNESLDFDEAFKNLLRPSELIAKENNREPLNYDLHKELNSYLNHLHKYSSDGSSDFVDASLLIQNVDFLYEKRADQVVDDTENYVRKLRSFQLNSTEFYMDVNEVENVEGNKRKKKEKKIEKSSFFKSYKDPIMKKNDGKVIIKRKKPVPTVILNTKDRVDNKKYSQIFSSICNENGENIRKKYDFELLFPLKHDLTVSEDFNYPTSGNQENVDEVDSVSISIQPSTPDPVVFEQTIGEICAHQGMASPVIMNLSEIVLSNNDDQIGRESVNKKEDNHYVDRRNNIFSLTKKKHLKKKVNRIWLPKDAIPKLIDENNEHLEIVKDTNEENYQTYKNDLIEMQKKHEQNQINIMNDQLAMPERVNLWHDNLWPKLEEEEKRMKFDINEYQTRILNCFSYIGERKSFEDLILGLEQEEVARYYLTVLMMANTYNLKIINDESDNGEMLIELLKKKRHHEELY